jgi:Zn-dependent peptidase ImmA (M78 family)/DNA-binding XRE family transcriptional regulator
MEAHIGARIKSARLLAGLTLRELEQKLEGIVSHTAIHKYEQGKLMPNGKTLMALANALDVRTDYLLRQPGIEISQIEFRKRSMLSAKSLNSIKERVLDTIERYIELESFLNLSVAFSNPIAEMVITDGADVERAAEKLLAAWDLGSNPIPNVIELLEEKEIKVIELEAEEKFDGLAGWANGIFPIIVVNRQYSVERKRFTALHELGHLLLNFAPGIEKKTIEKLCHRFAGAVLLPRASAKALLGQKRNAISMNELILIKESYGISIQAIMARAKDLEIITEDHFKRFRIKVNQNINLRKEIGYGQYQGVEHSSRFQQLLYRAAAEEIISMSKAASLANLKLAEFRDQYMAI